MSRRILVTGGCGYIGSHICIELLKAGHEIVVVDDLSNGRIEHVEIIEAITGKNVTFYKLDIRCTEELSQILNNGIDAVIHCAGLKSPTESIRKPLAYFDVNVSGAISLLNAMEMSNISQLVFSSTAAVYGVPDKVPVSESAVVGEMLNPYAETKLIIERLLSRYQSAQKGFQFVILRYFNPIGAHESGLLGENPKGELNNLMPHVCRVAINSDQKLTVFGDDFPTPDGTGVRDYIHVMDLARGHVSALDYLVAGNDFGLFNLGTGVGYSVIDLVKTFEQASGKSIPIEMSPRRKGDVASCFASVELAREKLDWEASRDLKAMCSDTWRWLEQNSSK